MTYLKYADLCATHVVNCLKEPAKTAGLSKTAMHVRITPWEGGKRMKTGAFGPAPAHSAALHWPVRAAHAEEGGGCYGTGLAVLQSDGAHLVRAATCTRAARPPLGLVVGSDAPLVVRPRRGCGEAGQGCRAGQLSAARGVAVSRGACVRGRSGLRSRGGEVKMSRHGGPYRGGSKSAHAVVTPCQWLRVRCGLGQLEQGPFEAASIRRADFGRKAGRWAIVPDVASKSGTGRRFVRAGGRLLPIGPDAATLRTLTRLEAPGGAAFSDSFSLRRRLSTSGAAARGRWSVVGLISSSVAAWC